MRWELRMESIFFLESRHELNFLALSSLFIVLVDPQVQIVLEWGEMIMKFEAIHKIK